MENSVINQKLIIKLTYKSRPFPVNLRDFLKRPISYLMFKWLLQDGSYLYKQKYNEYYLNNQYHFNSYWQQTTKKNPTMLLLRPLQSLNYFRES